MIIGLGHYSRTGKDSFANYFVECMKKHGGVRVLKQSFAWKLKQITYELYAWAGMKPPEHYDTKEGEKDRDVLLPDLGMTPVELWVKFGTNAIRNNVYDRTWVDYLLQSDLNCDILVIPDVRFPNEVEAIQGVGGLAIKVVRPGYGPRKTVADRALLGYDKWDYVIGSEGTMKSLKYWAERFAFTFGEGGDLPSQSQNERQHALEVEHIEPWTTQ
jgi:hypothetical protein